MLQIAEAFQYLHDRDVVHGDIQWVCVDATGANSYGMIHVLIRLSSAQPNVVILQRTVTIWNFGFYRTEFTESAESARSDYAAPDSYFREPTKEDDIYGCAMLFLSLAFAAASPAHIEQRLGPEGFGLCSSRFSMIRSKRWVVPDMPAIFKKLPCFSPDGSEQLWQLIVDMVEAHSNPSVTFGVVATRLRAIIGQ